MTGRPPQILVVDDEQHQLDTLCRGLLLYGHRPRGVLSAEAALAALGGVGGDEIQLVLTDLTMPGHAGLDLIQRIRRGWPGLPVVVITGLAASVEVGILRALNIPLLPKPFDPETLDATVRRVLRRSTV